MAYDPALVEDTRGWLTRASLDLHAAEKALKAFLAWHDEPFRKTHDLEELGGQVAAFDPSLRALVDRAGTLTEYAWE